MEWEVRFGDRIRRVELRRGSRGYSVRVDGATYAIDAAAGGGPFASLLVGSESYHLGVSARGSRYTVEVNGGSFAFDLFDPTVHWSGAGAEAPAGAGPREVAAVMPGRVVTVLVKEGDEVSAGQGLVVLEAMKMENEVQSPKSGRVAAVHVTPGQIVESGARIATLE
ncbi:MAG: biotin/lipoyl-binding protein [Acidobacteria bacterium]|nr:biotin/lipoyl-binding protein [Acidobacteriota bacterium]